MSSVSKGRCAVGRRCLRREPAATQTVRKITSGTNCRGCSGPCRVSSRPATARLVKPSTTINIGRETIGASDAALPVTTCAARTTRLPVMCAANTRPARAS